MASQQNLDQSQEFDSHSNSQGGPNGLGIRRSIHAVLGTRYGSALLLACFFVGVSTALRAAILIWWAPDFTWSFNLVGVFALGLLYDIVTFACISAPVVLFTMLSPRRMIESKINRWLSMIVYAGVIGGVYFIAASEWLFWDEFQVRFNFIAVDYLIYTQEVTDNIVESYPMIPIFATLGALVVVSVWVTRRQVLRCFRPEETRSQRWGIGLAWMGIAAVSFFFVDGSLSQISNNQYNCELSKNGAQSFVEAFVSNELSYPQFYVTGDPVDVDRRLRELVKEDNATFLHSNEPFNITRNITFSKPVQKYNFVVIPVESLSGEFMGFNGNTEGLTPNCDRLAEESVVFDRFYATGTRTVRGLEALTLSIPPLPGRSIVKRPHNENMNSLGFMFQHMGYDTEFLYGGYGYFDNMNYFFAHNGFKSTDRVDIPEESTTFTNAWGVCDEDLFDLVLRQADQSHAAGKPFFHMVMTTSNHRPFTYPDGKIDIPSGTGRSGAVKYTDYAIGRFIEQARTKPWFDNTVFVISADHCAGSAGKTKMPVDQRHIPCLLYAPKILSPRHVAAITSQIDIAPTLLGLVGKSYTSRFFGVDALADNAKQNRALVGTYQRLGLLRGENLTVLELKKQSTAYRVDKANAQSDALVENENLLDALAFYQSADYMLRHQLYGKVVQQTPPVQTAANPVRP